MFVQPAGQGLLADASPVHVRGRAQGMAGASGALGGAIAAFASLPLYHVSRAIPFVGAGAVIILGSVLAGLSAIVLARRQRNEAIGTPNVAGAPDHSSMTGT
jgi:MFS family permease